MSALTSSQPVTMPARVRLDYLDGLRGLAALYVVLSHTSILSMKLMSESEIPTRFTAMFSFFHFCFFSYGTYAVCVFIVLSGYCLMLPVVSSAGEALRGGFLGFIRRRARRIIPPYYAAMAICLIFFASAPLMHLNLQAMSWYPLANPVFTPGVLISHLLLLHCLTPTLINRIDPPMWSVSVEWNIYFLFVFLLLPLYQRFGAKALLVVSVIFGLAPHYLVGHRSDAAHPWMLTLFAFGMLGAVVNFSKKVPRKFLGQRLPWGYMAFVFGSILIALSFCQRASLLHVSALHWVRTETWGSVWPLEILAGLSAVCAIVAWTSALTIERPNTFFVRFLELPQVVALGIFSYSIYLVHDPILEVIWFMLKQQKLLPNVAVSLMFFAAVPIAVLLSYLFHLAFEKRFLPPHYKKLIGRAAAETSY